MNVEAIDDEDTFDDMPCEARGGIFEDTLDGLAYVDRNLLMFSAGCNLAAVCWLLLLGADVNARDGHGTTALHAACRSGSVGIVSRLAACRGIHIDVADQSGWTPLHISVSLGRRGVVLQLLWSRASLTPQTSSRKTVLDLCTDGWLRDAITHFLRHSSTSADEPWVYPRAGDVAKDFHTGSPRYEPSFVPREAAIVEAGGHDTELDRIGELLVHVAPGEGFAFLVATGCVVDLPEEMLGHLQQVNQKKLPVCNFLAAHYSLSAVLRVELLGAMDLKGLDVFDCLVKVFKQLRIPSDLQGLDRFARTLADSWWHQNTVGDMDSVEAQALPDSSSMQSCICSAVAMYQILFSVVLLNWSLHVAPFTPLKVLQAARITLDSWIKVNAGIGGNGGDLPQFFLVSLFKLAESKFIPEMGITLPDLITLVTGTDETTEFREDSLQLGLLRPVAELETFVTINVQFEKLSLAGVTPCVNISNIFSETVTVRPRPGRGDRAPPPMPQRGRGRSLVTTFNWTKEPLTRVWLSLCSTVLLFTASPEADEAPFAFVHLQQVSILSRDESLFTFVGGEMRGGMVDMIFLLPDGRWQEFEISRLEIELYLDSPEHVEVWDNAFKRHCGVLTGLETGD